MRSFKMFAAACVAVVALAFAAQAGNVVRYTDGTLGVVTSDKEVAERLPITVTPDALQYDDAWEKVVETGKPVPVDPRVVQTTRHFTLVTTTIADKAVVYDAARGVVSVENIRASVSTEERLNPFFILVGIALALMALANLLVLISRDAFSVAAAFAAFAAAAFAAAAAAFAAAFAVAAAVAAAFAVAADYTKVHYAASAVFYAAMLTAALITYF